MLTQRLIPTLIAITVIALLPACAAQASVPRAPSVVAVSSAPTLEPPPAPETPTTAPTSDPVDFRATLVSLSNATPTPTFDRAPYRATLDALGGATPTATPEDLDLIPTRAPYRASDADRATAIPTRTPTPRPANPTGRGFVPFTLGADTGWIGVSHCRTISEPGVYRLMDSLVSDDDCINIKSDNVIFDCQGFAINGRWANTYGIRVHQLGFIFGRPAQNIEIRNCRISGRKYPINVDAAENLYIHRNVTSGNYLDVDPKTLFGLFLGVPEGGGIRVNQTTHALIENNVADKQAIGIDVRDSSDVIVRDNSAAHNTAWGIHFYNVTNSEIADNTSSDNLRYCAWGTGVVGPGCDAGGIMLQGGSSYNVVRNNTISGDNGNGIFIKAHAQPCGDHNTIVGNTISDTLYNGIELSFCAENQVLDNRITNSLDAVWLGFSNHATIQGNTITNMSNHGVISLNSIENNVAENEITNANEGIYFYAEEFNRDEYYFLPRNGDFASHGNCLCGNTLRGNRAIAIHLLNSQHNRILNNRFINNGQNIFIQGNQAGNDIENNVPSDATPRGFSLTRAAVSPDIAAFLASRGFNLTRADLIRALVFDPRDSVDLRVFKTYLRASLFPGAFAETRAFVSSASLQDWWLDPVGE